MKTTAKQQAFNDMKASGISTQFLWLERAILEFTKTDKSIKRDFRKLCNGGSRKK